MGKFRVTHRIFNNYVRAFSAKPFCPHTKSLQKARALLKPTPRFYLRDHIATQLADRLQDISRSFPHALDLFCGTAHLYRALLPANHAQIERLYHADIHPLILSHAADHFKDDIAHRSDMFVFREPDSLLLPPASLDLILSGGALHWVNDLPAIVSQLVHRLSPDGLFLAAMLGGETLQELRISLQLAEQELRQRLAPRISPMIRVADAAHLLTAVGLALPTVDVERVVVRYPDIWALMRHIRGMGEGNALTAREPHCGRDVFDRAGEIYAQEFGDSDGLPATFEIIHLIGWRKATGQQRPSGRGSADVSLSDLVDSSQKSN